MFTIPTNPGFILLFDWGESCSSRELPSEGNDCRVLRIRAIQIWGAQSGSCAGKQGLGWG